MKFVENMALFLSLIGCLNFGIEAVFEFNTLQHLLVNFPALQRILYFLIGLSSFINILKIDFKKK